MTESGSAEGTAPTETQGGGELDVLRDQRRLGCCRLVSEVGSDWWEIDRRQIPWVLQAKVGV